MTRTIAIGDIHGCDNALEALLREIQPQRGDTIVGLGDFVDRGPQSAQVIERLIDLISKCRFVPLIGNHEIMMFGAMRNRREYEFWMQHGGASTLQSYGGNIHRVPQHHLTFLGHCQRYYQTADYFFIHANYTSDLPLDKQRDECIFWQHIFEDVPPPHISGKTAVVGHTPQMDGTVRNLGHLLMIDTFCYGEQWLTAIDVDSRQIWQSNQRGECRQVELPEMESV